MALKRWLLEQEYRETFGKVEGTKLAQATPPARSRLIYRHVLDTNRKASELKRFNNLFGMIRKLPAVVARWQGLVAASELRSRAPATFNDLTDLGPTTGIPAPIRSLLREIENNCLRKPVLNELAAFLSVEWSNVAPTPEPEWTANIGPLGWRSERHRILYLLRDFQTTYDDGETFLEIFGRMENEALAAVATLEMRSKFAFRWGTPEVRNKLRRLWWQSSYLMEPGEAGEIRQLLVSRGDFGRARRELLLRAAALDQILKLAAASQDLALHHRRPVQLALP